MRVGASLRSLEVDRPGQWVEPDHGPARLSGLRVLPILADPDLGLLPWIEPIAMDIGLLLLADDPVVGHAHERGSLVEQVLRGQLSEAEVLPPARLRVAPVPVDEPG